MTLKMAVELAMPSARVIKRGESEARILQQHPRAVAKIVEKRVHIIPRGGR